MRIWNRKSRLNSRLHSCEEADNFSPDRSGTNQDRSDVLNFNGSFLKRQKLFDVLSGILVLGQNVVSGEVNVFPAER
jgi:hypothetical protein